MSPLGGSTPAGVRARPRQLRSSDRPARRRTARAPSAELLPRRVADPAFLDGVDRPGGRPAPRRLGRAARGARDELDDGAHGRGGALDALVGHRLAGPARGAVHAGGAAAPAGATATWTRLRPLRHRRPRRGERGPAASRNFLAEVEAQQIPADTLAERGVRGAAVRLLTAHRAKGLEWDLVVVAGVQEGRWPDLRRRGDAAGGRPARPPTGWSEPAPARA